MAVKSNSPAAFLKYWLPVIIYGALIFSLSSVPGEQIPQLFNAQDIVFHAIEYGIFAILVSRAVKAYYPSINFVRRFGWVFLVSILYAISDEFHQSFITNRDASVFDTIIDSVGAFIGGWVYPWRK